MNNNNYDYDYAKQILRDSSYKNTDIKSEFFKSSPIILILMAIVLIILGSLITSIEYKDKQQYNELVESGYSTYGEVTDSRYHRSRSSSARKRYYYVKGTYQIDGTAYDFGFKSKIDLAEGSEIKIFYDEANPAIYVAEGEASGSIITSILIILAGVGLGVVGVKKHNDKKASGISGWL